MLWIHKGYYDIIIYILIAVLFIIKIKKKYLLSKVLEQIFYAFLLSKSFCKPASNIYSVKYMDNTFFLALKKRFCRNKYKKRKKEEKLSSFNSIKT